MSLKKAVKRWRLQIILCVSVAVIALSVLIVFLNSPPGTGKDVQVVEFGKRSGLRSFAEEMERKGVIRSARFLTLLARVKGVDSRLQAGIYQFNDAMKPAEILRKMAAGEVYAIRFAVPEGYSIYQLAELFESRGMFKKDDFLAACRDGGLLNSLGINAPSVEGYLYPATYNFTPGVTPGDAIRVMVSQFETVCGTRLSPLFSTRDRRRHQLVTLASLVEKEAVAPGERPLIASVFYNRLKKGMPLQSDPTAVYGVRAFAGKVSGTDVRRKTPYNTYLIKGLPPGPIGNPGAAALQAVLNPAATPYLYFVARKDGSHFFSTTLDQHNRAVTKYLKNTGPTTGGSEYRNDHQSLTDRR